MSSGRHQHATLSAALLASIACAGALGSTHAEAAPAEYRLHRVAVLVDVDDRDLRERMETRIVRQFTERRFQAVRSISVLHPEREFSSPEVDSAFNAHGIEALLLVTAGPRRSVAPEQMWLAARNAAWPWADFRAVLIEVQNREWAWTGAATGEPDQIRKSFASLCDDVVRKVVAARIMATRPPPGSSVAGTERLAVDSLGVLYVVNLEGGRSIGARRISLTPNGVLRIVDSSGKEIHVSAHKVRGIIDGFGIDRGPDVLLEGRSLP